MKLTLTSLFLLIVLIKINAFNQPPSIADIPDQVMNLDGTFPILDLNDYLTEPDGDEIEWSYYFTNTLSSGEVVDWDYTNQSPSMTILAKVNIRGEYNNANGDILSAFHDGEIKGEAEAIQVGADWLFFLVIDGEQAYDTISFKYYDSDQSTIFEVDDTVEFISMQTLGQPNAPYIMNAGFISVLDEGIPNTGILYPRAYDPNWQGVDTVYVVASEVSNQKSISDTAMIIFNSISNALPLDLISFRAKEIKGQSQLLWHIQSPENVLGFEIERGQIDNSSGIFKWEKLDFVSYVDHQLIYQFLDQFPYQGINYYRLKIIDLDGSYEFSPVISLSFEAYENTQVTVFPNPVFSNQQFFISIKTEIPTDIEIEILDQTGRLLKKNNFRTEGIYQYFPIEIGEMDVGFYLARIKVEHQVVNRSFVIVDD